MLFRSRIAANGYLAAAHSIDRFLAPFFVSVAGARKFRSLQARTGTLIGGLSALHFLERSSDSQVILELYAFFQHRHEIGQWLLDEGYSFAPTSRQKEDYLSTITDPHILKDEFFWPPSVCGVVSFKKFRSDLTQVEVHVSLAMRNPMEIALESSSSMLLCVLYMKPSLILSTISSHAPQCHKSQYSLLPISSRNPA